MLFDINNLNSYQKN